MANSINFNDPNNFGQAGRRPNTFATPPQPIDPTTGQPLQGAGTPVEQIRNTDQVDDTGAASDDPNRIPVFIDPFRGRSNQGSATGQYHDNIRAEFERIKPFLEEGTATEQDLAFINEFQKGPIPVVSDYLESKGGDIGLLRGGTQLGDAVRSAFDSGAIPPNDQFVLLKQVEAFTAFKDDFAEINKALLSSTLDVELEYGPLFEQAALDLQKEFQFQFAQIEQQTGIDLLKEFGSQLTDIEGDLRPADAALRKSIAREVQAGVDAGTSLTPAQEREFQQAVRGGQTARGTIHGNSAITSEATTRGQAGFELQQRRLSAGADLLRLNAQTQLDPISTILGRNVTRSPTPLQSDRLDPFAQNSFNTASNFAGSAFNSSEIDKRNAQLASLSRDQRKSGGGGGALSGALSGAATGFSVGGPFAALFGAAAGGIAGNQ